MHNRGLDRSYIPGKVELTNLRNRPSGRGDGREEMPGGLAGAGWTS